MEWQTKGNRELAGGAGRRGGGNKAQLGVGAGRGRQVELEPAKF